MPIDNPAPPVSGQIATGNYTGNGNDNRQIATGFKCSLAYVQRRGAAIAWTAIPNTGLEHKSASPYHIGYTVIEDRVLLHATDGFIVDNGTAGSANDNGITFDYWAISE